MKIIINVDEQQEEMEISISCKTLSPKIERVLAMIRMLDQQLTGIKDSTLYFIDVVDVIYIETVNSITFLYTNTDIYESNLKLYELEEQLEEIGFVRISKSCVMNIKQVVSLKADLNRRIIATMSNQEQIIISRQYATIVKERLGVK